MRHRVLPMLVIVAAAVLLSATARLQGGAVAVAQEVTEHGLLDNERVTVAEYVFPPTFRGEEHAAIADEFAYVLEGEFVVVTKGRGKRVVRKGEVEYAAKGTVHYSLNETKRPARVLVVLLKER